MFVNLASMSIHAWRSQFSKPPGSGVNLTPEPDSTPIIALFKKRTPWSDDSNFRHSYTCLQINFWTLKTIHFILKLFIWFFVYYNFTNDYMDNRKWAGGLAEESACSLSSMAGLCHLSCACRSLHSCCGLHNLHGFPSGLPWISSLPWKPVIC